MTKRTRSVYHQPPADLAQTIVPAPLSACTLAAICQDRDFSERCSAGVMTPLPAIESVFAAMSLPFRAYLTNLSSASIFISCLTPPVFDDLSAPTQSCKAPATKPDAASDLCACSWLRATL